MTLKIFAYFVYLWIGINFSIVVLFLYRCYLEHKLSRKKSSKVKDRS